MSCSLSSPKYRMTKATREQEKGGAFHHHVREQEHRREQEKLGRCPSCWRKAGCNCHNDDDNLPWLFEPELS